MKNCTPNARCRRLECSTCTWRYAGQIAQRIDLLNEGGPLLAVEFSGFKDFEIWRVAMRNLLDHRRRASKGWDDLLTHVWLCSDGASRGIIGTGTCGISEIANVLGRRWRLELRPMVSEGLRLETYRVLQQVAGSDRARYQHVKLAIWPRRGKSCADFVPARWIEPMPIIL